MSNFFLWDGKKKRREEKEVEMKVERPCGSGVNNDDGGSAFHIEPRWNRRSGRDGVVNVTADIDHNIVEKEEGEM